MGETRQNGQNTEPPGSTTVSGWLQRTEPEVEWDIEQLMAQGTTLIIAGNVGIGKSWETMHLAFQFRLGGKWHGLPCRNLMPISINLELTDRQMQRRIKKIAPQYDNARDINFIAAKGANLRINTSIGKDNLFLLLRSYGNEFGVIILDPLALFIDGEIQKVDWNGQVEPVLTKLKNDFHSSIVIDHNFRKIIHTPGHSEDLFAPDRLKGVSDIIDRTDNIVVFVSESQPRYVDGKPVRIEIAKWMHAVKTRDAELELKPHRVVWDYSKALFVPEEGLGWVPLQKPSKSL